MKKIHYFRTIALAFVAFATVSCGDKEADEPQQPAITMQNEQMLNQTAYADQTEGTSVSFTTTGDWTAEIGETATTVKAATAVPGWLSVNPASGGAGKNAFAVSLEPNYTGADRSAQITISSGNEQANVTVTQKSTTQDGKPNEQKYDIYVGGSRNHTHFGTSLGLTNISSSYWKNGEFKSVKSMRGGGIVDFAIAGDDVHFVGIGSQLEIVISGVYTYFITPWHLKNGVEIQLPITRRGNYATGIDISGMDVYVSGYEEAQYPDDYKPVAKYWKNNVVYLLGDGVRASYADGIKVSGNDVYVFGYYTDTDGDLECGYWKNGQLIPLSGEAKRLWSGEITDFCVVGNDVYVCGGAFDNTNYFRSIYWKNGEPRVQEISNNLASGGITVSGNDVYVWGQTDNPNNRNKPFATYWKNGVKTVLDIGYICDMAIVGKDVYVLANRYYEQSGGSQSVIYKNGEILVREITYYLGGRLVIVPHRTTRHW